MFSFLLLTCFLFSGMAARPEIRAKDDIITLQADSDIIFSISNSNTSLTDILDSMATNAQNAAIATNLVRSDASQSVASLEAIASSLSSGMLTSAASLETRFSTAISTDKSQLSSAVSSNANSLEASISQIGSQTVSMQMSVDAALVGQSSSLAQSQSSAVGSLETRQDQLSNTLSTTQEGLDATVSAEIATLEQLIQASNANLTLNLNDTVKISELETSLSNAIATNAVNLADNGRKDANTLTLVQSLSTQASADRRSLTNAETSLATAASQLTSVSNGLSSTSSLVTTLSGGLGSLTARVGTLEGQDLAAKYAALSTSTASLETRLSTSEDRFTTMNNCLNTGRKYDAANNKCYPTSCEEVLAADAAAATGEYMINGIKTTCYFVGGEAWTLVMKIPSDQSNGNFFYDSAYWWDSMSVNADKTDLMSDVELVHPFYHSMPIQGIRLAMGNLTRYHNHSISRSSAQALFTGDEILVNYYSRQDFLDLMPVDKRNRWNGQDNCNERAFQIRDESGVFCRYGIAMNNEDECRTSDSSLGFGCKQISRSTKSYGAGGMEVFNSFWTGRNIFLQGWIFVR
eukprot:TRINITY_DN10864_c0_g1_i1.p1 TRINITY_DN10864_c0_g1~~TRINITY_DN10864_c0_g1_i1.p1  ORF type:complete len:577 (+),score=136.93 TRINITY_DN10864_c0_g1_i1:1748-3478(+)